MTMQFHEVANIFPMMSDDEYAMLRDDIKANGLRQPIYTWQNKIIDGRNRYKACKELGITPRTEEWDGVGSLVQFVVSLNLARRHLTSSQKAAVAVDMLPMLEGEARQRMLSNLKNNAAASQKSGNHSNRIASALDAVATEIIPERDRSEAREQAAQIVGTNARYVSDAKRLHSEAPAMFEKVRSGEMTIPEAKRELKRAEVVKKLESVEAVQVKQAAGEYDVIVVDPPWPMQKIERDVAPEQVAFDYPTMTIDEISAMDLPAASDCHVWMWTTHKFIDAAFDILREWGAKYVCTFVWHKPGGFQPFGLPQYNCEFALYGRIGTPSFVNFKDFPVCFEAPRGAHSEKPERFYDIVRRTTAGRRIDMFNRRKIDGFDVWGKEAA